MFNKSQIRVSQKSWDNGFQKWVKRLYLVDDKEAARLSDWTVGYYYCEHCKAARGFAYQLPKNSGEVLTQAHNDWIEFLQAHAHGDGRPLLFERKILP